MLSPIALVLWVLADYQPKSSESDHMEQPITFEDLGMRLKNQLLHAVSLKVAHAQ